MSLRTSHIADLRDVDEVQAKACRVCGHFDNPRFLLNSNEESTEDGGKDGQYISPPWRTLEYVVQRGKYGCSRCSILSEICQFFVSDKNPDISSTWLRLCLSTRGRAPEMLIKDAGGVVKTVQLSTSTGFDPCWNAVPAITEIFHDRQSSASLTFIQSCLRSCVDHHELCKSPGLKLPTRVVDVGTGHSNQVRLAKTAGKAFEPYIALSYCWGQDGAMIKTTKEKLDNFESGISLSELPIVFRECISLSRSLGIRYVWIDALCIIQDHREDWEKESSKMSDTYAQAFLTIGASMSASTAESFLRISKHDIENKVFTKKVNFNGNISELRARRIPEVGIHSRWTDHHERGSCEPWSQRGWTLQEQLLSPRLLMFTSSEIQWSCQESQTCECQSRLNHRRLFGGHSWAEIKNASAAFNFWHKAVENYSSRTLNRCTDRLPALSGIAQTIQERTGSKYVAGLWSGNIAEDLLWERVGDSRTPTEYLAPSFSWASIVGEVDYRCYMNGKQRYREVSRVISISAHVQGRNQFGTVRGGEMSIRGQVTPITLVGVDIDGVYSVKVAGKNISFSADMALAAFKQYSEDGVPEVVACRSRTQMSTSVQTTREESATRIDYSSRDRNPSPLYPIPIEDGARCWLLALGFYLRPHSSLLQVCEFLVLGRHPDKPEKYERLGLLPIDSYLDSVSPAHPFLFDQERLETICIV